MISAITLTSRVEAALETVRPLLAKDGGNVRLVEITDEGTAVVAFEGNCIGCPTSVVTMKMAIERAVLESVPEITAVREETKRRPVSTFGSYVPPEPQQ